MTTEKLTHGQRRTKRRQEILASQHRILRHRAKGMNLRPLPKAIRRALAELRSL